MTFYRKSRMKPPPIPAPRPAPLPPIHATEEARVAVVEAMAAGVVAAGVAERPTQSYAFDAFAMATHAASAINAAQEELLVHEA